MEIRLAQREAFCRGCDATIKKGDSMFTTYSHRNRGQNIHFCMKCVEEIHEMFVSLDYLKAKYGS
jgi:hypothetical protein